MHYLDIMSRMYIRIKTTPNSPKRSVQIVESIRDGNKVRQKIIRHVGNALNDDELMRLKDLAEYIKAKIESEHQLSLFSPEQMAQLVIDARRRQVSDDKPIKVNLKELYEEQRTIIGIHEVYGKIYEELGFNTAIPNPVRTQTHNDLLHHIVMARIANPTSKREAVIMLERDFGVELPLQKVYRMMDKLDDKVVERIQEMSYSAIKTLLNEKINIIFYDCTTLYFESFNEDELKQNGYSKDCKFNQPQVLLALLVTQEGLPIGYEVFPGSCFEGHTLIPILKQLKIRYELEQVIFVADRGLLSEANLSYLEQEGFNYIVGARLKNLSTKLQEAILDNDNYQTIENETENKVAIFEQASKRQIIVSYSNKRARKDKYDREKAITKLCKKLSKSKDPKSLLNNYGYKKYIEIKGDAKISLNEEKIQSETNWDGLLGVITNIKDFKPEDILRQYHSLWQIEECFRINKHDLKIRPIFHWTPARVRAHIAICYIAFVCIRYLEYRVKMQYKKVSPEVIRKELSHVQISVLKDRKTGKRYCVPSKVGEDTRKIYHIMGMKLSTTPFEIAD